MTTQRHRVLIIHAGGGKTGSSALQSVLAETSARLAEVGISYVNAPPTQSPYAITSGNGTALYDLVATPRWNKEGADLIDNYFGSFAIAICSNEFLGSMSADEWRRLLKTAAELDIAVRVVFFVRSAGSYLASCYNQDVKRGVHDTFDEYLIGATWHHLDALRTLDEVIPAECLKVLNYEACVRDVAGAFAAAIEELAPARGILHEVPRRKVNRSLDPVEIAMVRLVNRKLGGSAGEALSDRLIYESPEKQGGTSLDPEQADIVAAKYADGTSWLNARFFASSANPLPLRSSPDPRLDAGDEALAQTIESALEWALEQGGARPHAEADNIYRALHGIDWQNSGHAEVPIGFDPIAYLIMNVDVLQAGVPPYAHFLSSGKFENRQYRWPQPRDARHDSEIEDVLGIQSERPGWEADDSQQKLRFQYQIEGLLHAFAARERGYLDEIRKLTERAAFSRAESRVVMEDVTSTIVRALVDDRRRGSDELAAALMGAGEATKHDLLDALKGRFDETAEAMRRLAEDSATMIDGSSRVVVDAIRTALQDLGDRQSSAQTNSDGFAQEAAASHSRAIAEMRRESNAADLTMQESLCTLQDELSRLNEGLAEKDAELARQRAIVSRYREASSMGFMWWGIRRTKRP